VSCPECSGSGWGYEAPCWRCDGVGRTPQDLVQVLRDLELLLAANASNEIRVLSARARLRQVLSVVEALERRA
jgi:hypothetical protein